MSERPPNRAHHGVPDSLPGSASALEVLLAFLRLGLTSFGGPVAHLGYFRTEFVERRRWLADGQYADLVALCQFLPGPASSQVGMALGLQRAGWLGALAAWTGFTLPSALALLLLAELFTRHPGWAQSGVVHGLKLLAVAVVAQAVSGMARTLCPDRARAAVATAAAVLVLTVPAAAGQIGAMLLGAAAGLIWLRLPACDAQAEARAANAGWTLSRRTGAALLLLCAAGLVALPALAQASAAPWLQALATVYQAGALVFGGGHVVLPLLQAGVVPPGWVGNDAFLAGYAAAQAVPGPLFTFAAYLGALMPAPLGGWAGAGALLLAIFTPAFLLVAGALPFWQALRQHARMQRAMAGTNAAVVGVLAAALYDPVFRSAVHHPRDAALALAVYGLLVHARLSPLVVVALAAAAGAWLGR